MTATTALTAQNTTGVFDIHYTPPEFVGKLIELSIGDIGVDVVKTGLFFLLLCPLIVACVCSLRKFASTLDFF